jgi:XRE family aerobic/anaerobic benzoate catabolism transcriptional regulator
VRGTDADRLLARLGKRVRALRTGRDWSLKQLAVGSGLSSRFLSLVESGQGNLSIRSLAGLARCLDTTPAALLCGPDGAAPRKPPVVALLGLRGAGKTTVGRALARLLRMRFVELDRRVEQAAGLSLAEIFSLHGEAYHRRLEREALDRVLAEPNPVVLATGGGLVTSPETWALLRRRTFTVWLRAEAEDHWQRVVRQGDRRPMADHPEAMAELRRLLASRARFYAEAALVVDTSGRRPAEVVRRIGERLAAG